MPYYEYMCTANGQTIEVRHGMSEELTTWGQVADRAAVDVGDTPANAPVQRIMSAPVPVTTRDPGFQGCSGGCACAAPN
ncbi:MAG: zinc ribbon domain-containing protein [Longimicrobiales bacterium]